MQMDQWSTVRIGPEPHIAVDHMGAGELVIFLHGVGGNKRNWHDNLAAFGEHFHAAAWDARGYGESDDYDGDLDRLDFVHDLSRVLDFFGEERAHIIGLSMGGQIAMGFAEHYPDRLLTLTLCATVNGFPHLSEADRAEFVRRRKEPLVGGKEPKDIAVPVAKTLVGPKASPEAFDKLVDSISLLHKLSYIKTIESSVKSKAHTKLGEIRVPTHVMCGEEDRLSTPTIAREIAAMIPNAEVTIIPEAGHLINIERPAEFNSAALGFLFRHRKGD
jgi:3-oxoadipate enol-lactonase